MATFNLRQGFKIFPALSNPLRFRFNSLLPTSNVSEFKILTFKSLLKWSKLFKLIYMSNELYGRVRTHKSINL